MCILFLKSARCSLKLRTPLLRFCFATVLFIPMNGYINFRTHLQPVDQWASDVLYFTEHEWMLMVGAHSPSSIPLKICSPSDLLNFFNVQGFSRAGYPYFIFSLPVYSPRFDICLFQKKKKRFDICVWFGCDYKESPCRKEAIYIYIYLIFNRSFFLPNKVYIIKIIVVLN